MVSRDTSVMVDVEVALLLADSLVIIGFSALKSGSLAQFLQEVIRSDLGLGFIDSLVIFSQSVLFVVFLKSQSGLFFFDLLSFGFFFSNINGSFTFNGGLSPVALTGTALLGLATIGLVTSTTVSVKRVGLFSDTLFLSDFLSSGVFFLLRSRAFTLGLFISGSGASNLLGLSGILFVVRGILGEGIEDVKLVGHC
jgi:hypothetical protein